MKLLWVLCVGSLLVLGGPAAAQGLKPDLLIVGSPHLANPNRDMVKSAVPDIASPDRQREIVALVDALARYRPTRIAIEVRAKDQALLDERYAAYRRGEAALLPTEMDQIAFRLAAKLGLPHLDAVDWNEKPPMAEADYDFQAWAQSNGRGADLEALLSRTQRATQAMQARWPCTSVGDWYRQLNTPAHRHADNQVYLDIAMFGDAGPNWVGGAWYMRNLRIVSQLRRVAKPGDRVLVLFGAGHAFPIDAYARQSEAFTVSDTLAYLPDSSRDRC